jgi:hypothetical protein
MRTVLAAVVFCALALGGLRWQIDNYRTEWETEQIALAEMKAAGGNFMAGMRPIGPAWVRMLVGPERAKCFDNVRGLGFVGSDRRLADKHRKSFKHLRAITQD